MSYQDGKDSKEFHIGRKGKISIAAGLLSLATLFTLVPGEGNGKVKIETLDDIRSTIICEVPPEGIEADNYEVFYQQSSMGRVVLKDPDGVPVLTALLKKKSDFNIKFYNCESFVGEQSLDKFDVDRMDSASAAITDLGGLDLHLEMLGRRQFRLYSTNVSSVPEEPLTMLVFDRVVNTQELFSDSSQENIDYINTILVYMNQLDTATEIDRPFGVPYPRIAEDPTMFYFLSSYWQTPKILRIPQAIDVEGEGAQMLLDLVPDNSLKINNDIYTLDSVYYTRDNIIASRQRANSTVDICYKINGMWFDLMDPSYTSVSYFTESNAIPQSTLDQWVPDLDRYYQGMFDYIGFTNSIDLDFEESNNMLNNFHNGVIE